MDVEEMKQKIEQARLAIEDLEEPLKSVAFRVILNRLVDEEPAARNAGAKPKPRLNMQLVEFLATKNTQSHPDRVVSIMYHYFQNGIESMASPEILEAYGRIRAAWPKNLSDVIAQGVRKGHIIEALEKKDGQKAWQITLTGEKYGGKEMLKRRLLDS